MEFKILHKDKKSNARAGELKLSHGIVKTPAFVPVGTQASVKALSPRDLKDIRVQLFFSNTYHLYLRPGPDIIQKLGGLHEFMNWDGPIMTDSGGFQVFSLGLGQIKLKAKSGKVKIAWLGENRKGVTSERLAEITEKGVKFKSHIDGSEHLLTPEKSMQIQRQLGADIMMAFDDCTPYSCKYDYAKKSMERTHRWAMRSLKASAKLKSKDQKSNRKNQQSLFGVVQGSVYEDLRKKSAQFINSLNTPGIAIGGVSVGETKNEMYKVVDWVIPLLDQKKPRHLLGVGEIDDIFEAVERGIDSLDCVTPTRWARNGTLLVHPEVSKKEKSKTKYRLLIKNAKYIKDPKSIDKNCNCYVCQNFSRAYLNHLYRVNEILGIYLGTYHNVYFMIELMRKIRKAILEGEFLELKKKFMV